MAAPLRPRFVPSTTDGAMGGALVVVVVGDDGAANEAFFVVGPGANVLFVPNVGANFTYLHPLLVGEAAESRSSLVHPVRNALAIVEEKQGFAFPESPELQNGGVSVVLKAFPNGFRGVFFRDVMNYSLAGIFRRGGVGGGRVCLTRDVYGLHFAVGLGSFGIRRADDEHVLLRVFSEQLTGWW